MKFYYKPDEASGNGDTPDPGSGDTPASKVNLSWLPWVLGVIAAVLVFKPGLLKKLSLKKLNPFQKKTS